MVARLHGGLVGLEGSGQAIMGAGLLVLLTRLIRCLERGRVLGTCGGGAAGGEQHLAKTVERAGAAGQVPGLRAQREGLAEQGGGLLVLALPRRTRPRMVRASDSLTRSPISRNSVSP